MPHSSGECAAKKGVEVSLEDLNAPWREVLHLGVRCCFPKQHMEPGSRLRGFYFISSGRVCLSYMGEMGEERNSLYLGRDCIFNEIPALANQLLYNVGFYCMEATDAWRFDAALLGDVAFLARYPHLVANLLRSMAKKSSVFFFHLARTRSSSSMSRLCDLLLQLTDAKQRGKLRMSQSDAAAMLGLHQTTVARLIRRLRDEGVIGRFTKNELQVLDVARLREMAHATDASTK